MSVYLRHPVNGDTLQLTGLYSRVGTDTVALQQLYLPHGDNDALCLQLAPPAIAQAMVSTVAGGNTGGHQDGAAIQSLLYHPKGVAVAADGSVYVADYNNHRIRKLTPDGRVDTVAGDGTSAHLDGAAAQARFSHPSGVAVAADGSVYVADSDNHRIRKLATDGQVSTVAGDGSTASFKQPTGVAVAADGSVYVADTGNHRIRRITPDGKVSTVAGDGTQAYLDGTAAQARFSRPTGVAVAADGSVYVADSYNHRIRRIAPDGQVSTVAGDGMTPNLNHPSGVAVAADGSIYIADYDNHYVRKITPDGKVRAMAGDGTYGFLNGTTSQARFYNPHAVAVAPDGSVYVADQENHRIRKITFYTPA